MAKITANAVPSPTDVGEDWHKLAVLSVESDAVAYDGGTVAIFELPVNTELMAIVCDPETAFDAGDGSVEITDTAGNVLMKIGGGSLLNTQPMEQLVYRKYASGSTITAAVGAGAASAGSLRFHIMYRSHAGYKYQH